jgi:hypothetical protein
MGSGHILVYTFDVLMQIYESYGHSQREAAKSILENNIFGLDIDNRAYQLSYFALMMKARYYNRRILDGSQKCHVYSIQESNGINRSQLDFFGSKLSDFERNTAKLQAQKLIETFVDAKEYGSILNVEPLNWELISRFVGDVDFGSQMSLEAIGIEETQSRLVDIIQIAEILARKYDVVATNPPYMGLSNGNGKINEYVKKHFADSKTDLFAVFIERCDQMVNKNRFKAMITQHSWMFLSSFEKLRSKILSNTLINMAHLGARAFEEIGGEVVQTTSWIELKVESGYKGAYSRLVDFSSQKKKELAFLSHSNLHFASGSNFSKIPGSPIAYWISNNVLKAYEHGDSLGKTAIPKTGMTTGDNNRFLRLWHEIGIIKAKFDSLNAEDAKKSGKKWFPYSKGGGFRRWYGYNEYLINWENNGHDIKNNIKDNGLKAASVRSENLYFKNLISWSAVSSGKFSCRAVERGTLFDSGGSSISTLNNSIYILAFLNGKIGQYFLDISNATINYQPGDIAGLPLVIKNIDIIESIANKNIEISKVDWDCDEVSWDFKEHPLIKDISIKNAFINWENDCASRFIQLKSNEEELNRIFIDIYGLQDELTPEVDDKDVTVRKADLQRDVKSFISYAVGCMFGRYSLDVGGLAYAGGEWEDSKYSQFIPDKDNCIPITDDEYFPEDDIVNRFIEFIKVVYGIDTFKENLDFIANTLDVKGNDSKEVIRNYFVKDFYKDHVKTYQKRPIYWLYDSGKQDGFKALVYMHRYTADTTGIVRVDYLHTLQKKYATEIENLKDFAAKTDNAREAAQAQKHIDKIKKQLNETESYDEKLGHLALSRISIDLDDGVKVNYEKVQTDAEGIKYEILAKI